MKIGMLGTGQVGQALGAGFVALGHDVMMGSREPGSPKAQTWVAEHGERASAGTLADAAAFADVAVLATAWRGTAYALQLADPANLAGKVVIDVTNPLDFSTGAPRLAVSGNDSAGEQIQNSLPKARVVKAFNIVGNAHMFRPDFPGGPPDMFICGNDDDAKQAVTDICAAFGWPTIDIGGIEGARLLEALAMLWINQGFRTGSWDHAFKLLQK